VDLARSLDEHQDAARLQIAVLSFVNAIINYKAGEVSCNLMYVQRRFIRTMIAVALPVNNKCAVATDTQENLFYSTMFAIACYNVRWPRVHGLYSIIAVQVYDYVLLVFVGDP